ncbi:MAG: site-2 protease family protein [Candidatus Pacebacteria bacterium]|nr:site-2 protease family protein [Candidatus Paceibacterota bacterium]
MAELFGDPTARLAGRLTLNPIPHIDPLGSIILPAIMMIASKGSFAFGWAKPVPYNPHNLRNFKWGTFSVAIAGVLANLFLAVFFGLMIRFHALLGISSASFIQILVTIVEVNLVLAVFNMIPVPPLDGSKALFSLLPYRFNHIYEYMERNWIIFIIFVMFLGSQIIAPISFYLLTLITGIN